MTNETDLAARALACLDLTNLEDDCGEAEIIELCRRARTPHGPVAAVCVWNRHVGLARRELAGSGVRIATVLNFPGGDGDLVLLCGEAEAALVDGADEIDLVAPWRSLTDDHPEMVAATVREIKDICDNHILKVILETGELKDPELIRKAATEALAGGADFLKTSTGRARVNATPEAAAILLDAIRDTDSPAGLKPAGGIRTLEEAGAYFDLCESYMGPDWATPARFRIGASSLLSELLGVLGPDDAPEGEDG